MTNKELLNSLYKKFNLLKTDYFRGGDFTIIKRCGIEKIQAKAGIDIKFELAYASIDNVIMKAMASVTHRGDSMFPDMTLKIETFGEASPHNYPKEPGKPYYPAAMAEKRAMSRAVLKLAGFYELEVFGEDEMPDTKKTPKLNTVFTSETIVEKAIKAVTKKVE